MARNTNLVVLTGYLGADPEIRQFQNGGQIAVLNLAVGDDYRDKQGNVVNRTHWIPVVIHGNYSEVARNYLHKGSKITVEGKLIQESWQTQNGETRTTLKVAAKMFEMLDGKPKADNQTSTAPNKQSKPPQSPPAQDDSGFNDDIPKRYRNNRSRGEI